MRRSVFCWRGKSADWQQATAYVSLTRLFMRLLIVNLVRLKMSVIVQHLFHYYHETVVKEFPKLDILVTTSLLLILWVNDLNKLAVIWKNWYTVNSVEIYEALVRNKSVSNQTACCWSTRQMCTTSLNMSEICVGKSFDYTKLQIVQISFGMSAFKVTVKQK